jgi:hypothetical protein
MERMVYYNGRLNLSFLDSTGLATFSGPDNIMYFFIDDFQTLQHFPPEAGVSPRQRIVTIRLTSQLRN